MALSTHDAAASSSVSRKWGEIYALRARGAYQGSVLCPLNTALSFLSSFFLQRQMLNVAEWETIKLRDTFVLKLHSAAAEEDGRRSAAARFLLACRRCICT